MGDRTETLKTTEYELAECKNFLNKECGTNSRLKQELEQFKVRGRNIKVGY